MNTLAFCILLHFLFCRGVSSIGLGPHAHRNQLMADFGLLPNAPISEAFPVTRYVLKACKHDTSGSGSAFSRAPDGIVRLQSRWSRPQTLPIRARTITQHALNHVTHATFLTPC